MGTGRDRDERRSAATHADAEPAGLPLPRLRPPTARAAADARVAACTVGAARPSSSNVRCECSPTRRCTDDCFHFCCRCVRYAHHCVGMLCVCCTPRPVSRALCSMPSGILHVVRPVANCMPRGSSYAANQTFNAREAETLPEKIGVQHKRVACESTRALGRSRAEGDGGGR
jgi:hypothetical protein